MLHFLDGVRRITERSSHCRNLLKSFDYHHMSKSPAVFDINKLKWMNGEYLKAMDFDKFYELAEPYIKKVITKDYDLKRLRL